MQHVEGREQRVGERRGRDRRIRERRVLSGWGRIEELNGEHRERRARERRGASWLAGERRRRERRRAPGRTPVRAPEGTAEYRLGKPEDMAFVERTPVPDQTLARGRNEPFDLRPAQAGVTCLSGQLDHSL